VHAFLACVMIAACEELAQFLSISVSFFIAIGIASLSLCVAAVISTALVVA